MRCNAATMSIPGKYVRVSQWSHAGPCVVQVEVDAIVPDEDPAEPCFEPTTIRLLDHLQELANAGRVEELARHGVVYVRQSA